MAGTWFPTWLLLVMTVAYAGIAAVHLATAATQRGPALLWTSVHLLMATGMLAMVLPVDRMPVSGTLVVPAFAAAALVCLVVAVAAVKRGSGSALWFTAVVDLVAMAYMFSGSSARSVAVSLLLAVFLAVEAAYWTSGYFAEFAERDGLSCAPTVPERPTTVAAGMPGPVDVAVDVRPTRSTARPVAVAALTHPVVLRTAMSVMAVGMAYMLAAMALGMPSLPGGSMPGMKGM